MRFSWWCNLPLLAAAALGAPGCSVGAWDRFEDPETQTKDPPGRGTHLAFTEKGALTLAPGEERALSVSIDPPGRYEISFAILGSADGASLDQAKVMAGADGTATVTLKAPNVSTAFRVRASIEGGPAADTEVFVSDQAFGSVRVVPVYVGGREVTFWTASVMPGSYCKSIEAAAAGEQKGTLTVSAPAGEDLVIKEVPAGPNLAVVLRSGLKMWGCSDAPNLLAGEELAVKVTVVDKPLDLLSTDLDLTFSFTPSEPDEYGALLEGAAAKLAKGFLSASSEAAAGELLDAMQKAVPEGTLSSFEQHRTENGWDAVVAQHLSALPVSLQDQVKKWSLDAIAPKGDPSAPQESQMIARLHSIGQAQSKALLEVSKLGAVDARKAGIPDTHLMSWTADANDTVMLGGSIFWLPTRYVGAATLLAVKEQVQGVATVSEALSQVLGCGVLGAAMGGFEGCDTQCTAGLCTAALAARWEEGQDASANEGEVGEISITASAPAKVDDDAAPLSFDGKWIGIVSADGISTKIAGPAIGLRPALKP